ncbi:acetyltransferase [Algoriphagus sp.]|uniref:acetyltransferase n=1 Tax=Algoriphagus sp. TaxID=1872435 RepID=UPI0026335573|nr:acetyltransferase [Algoriphagus sp.]
MIITGAGGHALEVLDEWIKILSNQEFKFFDDIDGGHIFLQGRYQVIKDEDMLKNELVRQPKFSLGVGNPTIRKKFYDLFTRLGGKYEPLLSKTCQISDSASGRFDAMTGSFVGPLATIGLGSLINVGAHVHHEAQLGDFVEVGPGALILGNVQIGSFCRIGAGSVILPGVKIGNQVNVGAGAVVTKKVCSGQTVKGIPAK